MRGEVAHSMIPSRSLWHSGHQSEKEEGKSTPTGEENLGGGILVKMMLLSNPERGILGSEGSEGPQPGGLSTTRLYLINFSTDAERNFRVYKAGRL